MGIGVILLGMAVVWLLVFLWIGGPILLTDWVRNRRREAIRRQIALTEAIEGQFGSIVAPVVQKRLWGPWQIRIAVPFTRPSAVAKILSLAHEMLSAADRMKPSRYQIVLTPQPESIHEKRETRESQSVARWPNEIVAA